MKIQGVALIIAVVGSILFAVACGGGKDGDAPADVKGIASTNTPEPTSVPDAVSPQSPKQPPISMLLETVSPELLSCVQTALGDEQYNAIISGRQDAVSEQLGIVLPCILQYPQEANAIMEMFGLDMGTIMAASTPIPNTQPHRPTNTSIPQPTNTPKTIPIATPVASQIPSSANLPTPETSETSSLTAKQRLISIGFNVPRAVPFSEAEQEYVASLDIPLEYQERYIEVQNNLNTVLGAYPNYIYVAFNPDGTEEDAQPVYDRLTTAKFRGHEDGYSVAELTNIKSCLTGSDPGGARSPTTNQISLCIEDLPFIENPFSSDPLVGSERRHAKMTLHLAHEYFHHYQRAHALDRGLDHQEDRSNPTTTVQAPRWWTEGAAVTFQNAWYQANWQSLSFLTDQSNRDVSIASVATSNDYKRVRTTIMGGTVSEQEKRANSCTFDWRMTSDDNLSMTCEGAMLATAFMAYKSSYKTVWIDIPQDYYDLGFWGAVKKHLGFTEQEFFDEYNAFMRSGDPGDEPPAGWSPPQGPISAYADFLQIIPESDPVDANPHY